MFTRRFRHGLGTNVRINIRSVSGITARNQHSRRIKATKQPVPPLSWPVNLLDDAHKSGLISLSSLTAKNFLAEFADAAKDGPPSASTIRQLIMRHDVEPRTMFWLGWILQKAIAGDPALGTIAKLLHTSAATLRDEYASLILVESALRAKKPFHPDVSDALQTIIDLTKQGNVFAKERLAALHEQRGDKVQALSLAEEALRSPIAHSANQSIFLDPKFSAWKTVARLRQEMKGLDSDHLDAMEYGAKVLDDPDAYFDLATEPVNEQSQQGFTYLLKAAATGDARAAHIVADRYFERAMGKTAATAKTSDSQADASPETGGMAKYGDFNLALASEWYELALKSSKHGSESNREAAGKSLIVALRLLKDGNREHAIAEQHSGIQWAKGRVSRDP